MYYTYPAAYETYPGTATIYVGALESYTPFKIGLTKLTLV